MVWMFWKLFDYINFNLASVFYNPMFTGQVVRSPNDKQDVIKAFFVFFLRRQSQLY